MPMITDAAYHAAAAGNAGGGLLHHCNNHANQTNVAMEELLGITLEENAACIGTQDHRRAFKFNATIRLIKQDINIVEKLDQVTSSYWKMREKKKGHL